MSSTHSRKKPTTASLRRSVSSASSQKGSGSQKRSRGEVEVTISSGNVFADLGLANPEELLFKADLAIAIGAIIQRRRLSQSSAAEIIGIDQPKVSALMSGDTRGFSADRLIKILTRLGQDVEIRVHNSPKAMGRVRVAA
jgi:predicted XRE-type DNA-binding protein